MTAEGEKPYEVHLISKPNGTSDPTSTELNMQKFEFGTDQLQQAVALVRKKIESSALGEYVNVVMINTENARNKVGIIFIGTEETLPDDIRGQTTFVTLGIGSINDDLSIKKPDKKRSEPPYVGLPPGGSGPIRLG